ncbi:hypothetical protein EJ02DRAFT_339008, partial [Clathrospora elynae]
TPTKFITQGSPMISKSRRKARKHHVKFHRPLYNDPITVAARDASPLLSLPGEMRSIIYRHALTSSTGSLGFGAEEQRFDCSRIGAGLIGTYHSVAVEMRYLYLGLNNLAFNAERIDTWDLRTVLAGFDSMARGTGWEIVVNVVGLGEA